MVRFLRSQLLHITSDFTFFRFWLYYIWTKLLEYWGKCIKCFYMVIIFIFWFYVCSLGASLITCRFFLATALICYILSSICSCNMLCHTSLNPSHVFWVDDHLLLEFQELLTSSYLCCLGCLKNKNMPIKTQALIKKKWESLV